MQRRQRSLISFFPIGSSEGTRNKAPSSCQLTNEEEVGGPLAHTTQGQASFQRSFSALKDKFLRPQKSVSLEENNHFVAVQTGDEVSVSLPGVGGKESVCEEEHGRVRDLWPHNAPEFRHSILGIKRVRDEHDTAANSRMSDTHLLKRKKLLELLGEGEEQHGLWEEARAKFEWLSSSKLRDGKGRYPGEPLFDSRTVRIPPDVLNKMSASQKQYWLTKCEYMDTLLFFKVGKFYELYEVDAEIGHKELNWKMTVSGVGKCRQVGVPESGIEDAVCKLLARGYKVGRMEQIETGQQAKAKRGPGAMVQRRLTHVFTPSTAMDDNMRPDAVHLLALCEEPRPHCLVADQKAVFGFAFVDAAAGRFYVGSLHDDASRTALGALLTQVAPQELLYELGGLSNETMKALKRHSCHGFLPLELTPLQPNVEFLEASAAVNLIQSLGYFKEKTGLENHAESDRWLRVLKKVNDFNPAAVALGALAHHLHRMKLAKALEDGVLALYEVFKGSLRLDGQTLSNLEIFHNNSDGGKAGSLLSFLNNCVTPFGKRLLRRWMCHPLQKIEEINDRLDAVEELMYCPGLIGNLRTGLRQLPDLERLVSRIRSCGSVDIAAIPLLWNRFQRQKMEAVCSVVKGLLSGLDLLSSLFNINEQGCLHSRILQRVSKLQGTNDAKNSLLSMAAEVEERFTFLKLHYSKQDKALDAKDTEVLSHLLITLNEHMEFWLLLIDSLSQLDVLISFAVSTEGANGPTCRPAFVSTSNAANEGSVLKIKELWHPFATGGQCDIIVRNDVVLGCEINSPRAMLLTGPNMGGKSTLMRATCLLVVLAQMGCYVPAKSCVLSPVDTIFTRLGASDRIMLGESTFMVECLEASSTLRYATKNSLVILDELGRGTSTFDGYAIAYAVFRHLVDKIDCRLLFATHYHPLTIEFAAHPSVTLQHMACAFEENATGCKAQKLKSLNKDSSETFSSDRHVTFLYKLSSGASPDSYGLHVASLANIPKSVIERAGEARSIIKSRLSSSFESIVHRQHFSYVNEQWLKSILAIQCSSTSNYELVDAEDAYDTLLCIWHELQSSMGKEHLV